LQWSQGPAVDKQGCTHEARFQWQSTDPNRGASRSGSKSAMLQKWSWTYESFAINGSGFELSNGGRALGRWEASGCGGPTILWQKVSFDQNKALLRSGRSKVNFALLRFSVRKVPDSAAELLYGKGGRPTKTKPSLACRLGRGNSTCCHVNKTLLTLLTKSLLTFSYLITKFP
jgi:hypothetical protein